MFNTKFVKGGNFYNNISWVLCLTMIACLFYSFLALDPFLYWRISVPVIITGIISAVLGIFYNLVLKIQGGLIETEAVKGTKRYGSRFVMSLLFACAFFIVCSAIIDAGIFIESVVSKTYIFSMAFSFFVMVALIVRLKLKFKPQWQQKRLQKRRNDFDISCQKVLECGDLTQEQCDIACTIADFVKKSENEQTIESYTDNMNKILAGSSAKNIFTQSESSKFHN